MNGQNLTHPTFLIWEKIRRYGKEDFGKWIDEQDFNIIMNNKHMGYYNIPAAFDIETTSFSAQTENGEETKVGIMYLWGLGINGAAFYGRTWEEAIEAFEILSEKLCLCTERRLIIYCHNLSFEFQFLRKRLSWEKIFATDERKPLYALTVTGIEFRCSYRLSGYSLAKLSDQLIKYKVYKRVGDLDYRLYRHSQTPITEKELDYQLGDLQVVMAYIQEKIENENGITNIPLTKTGYVRRYCRTECMGNGTKSNKSRYNDYRKLMNALTITLPEYEQLKRAFAGGYTHASALMADKVIYNVCSYDRISSYPAVMVAEKYPMEKAELIEKLDKETFDTSIRLYCCLFDCEFIGLESTFFADHYISLHKCYGVIGCQTDNGRIVRAERILCTITDVDYNIIKSTYSWKHLRVFNFRRYKKSYLPTQFIKSILRLYKDKTELKGVIGKEIEYLIGKENVNAAYGMIVTDIIREDIIYDGDWKTETADREKQIETYNNGKKRFLFYPWGVWVTAYARNELWKVILHVGADHCYSDTDSDKIINGEKYNEFFAAYNADIIRKMDKALAYHGIDLEASRPRTIKGEPKQLGIFELDGTYKRFKTLGAKRYIVETENGINITVSGLNKGRVVPYLETLGKDLFEQFEDGLYIPRNYKHNGETIDNPSGKMSIAYVDDEKRGYITDYKGVTIPYHELSSVYMESADYLLGMGDYIDYLKGVQTRKE